MCLEQTTLQLAVQRKSEPTSAELIAAKEDTKHQIGNISQRKKMNVKNSVKQLRGLIWVCGWPFVQRDQRSTGKCITSIT